MIASPSDVTAERDIAVQVIQDWNDLHSADRQTVLLPLRWETHSVPEYGRRPQGSINKQVVDNADLLIGIFWTKLGSSTGVAESGTIEEIERVAGSGKPVLLYFSKIPQTPDSIDLEQLAKLRDFKERTKPGALVSFYNAHEEFRKQLHSHLEQKVRELMTSESSLEQDPIEMKTDIVFRFADVASGQELPATLTVPIERIRFDLDEIPDYEPTLESQRAAGSKLNFNRDFLRQYVLYLNASRIFTTIRFSLKNVGGVGARNVYVELAFYSDTHFALLEKNQLPSSEPSRIAPGLLGASYDWNKFLDIELAAGWESSLEIDALQPQRQLSPNIVFALSAKENCLINVSATIYADTLPKPLKKELFLNLIVHESNPSKEELLAGLPGSHDR